VAEAALVLLEPLEIQSLIILAMAVLALHLPSQARRYITLAEAAEVEIQAVAAAQAEMAAAAQGQLPLEEQLGLPTLAAGAEVLQITPMAQQEVLV
jgi:uncharacterized protein (DUF2147 family)